MTDPQLPAGFRLERLRRDHARKSFRCGESAVDDWLSAKSLQGQEKRLTVTKVLLTGVNTIAGYYTLGTGQIDFSELPPDITKRLPRRQLPIAVLAWLGVATAFHKQSLGRLLLAQALRDCYDASQTFAFVAVILDCLGDAAKAFYQQWDFAELPGHPYRLFVTAQQLEAMMAKER